MATVEIFEDAIEAMFHEPEGPVAELMEDKGNDVQDAAEFLMMSGGGGGFYEPGVKFFRRGAKVYRWERATGHEASAPGTPAAEDSGEMLASYGVEMEDGPGGMEAHVYNDSGHALYVELGTRYMMRRPTLVPALDIGVR